MTQPEQIPRSLCVSALICPCQRSTAGEMQVASIACWHLPSLNVTSGLMPDRPRLPCSAGSPAVMHPPNAHPGVAHLGPGEGQDERVHGLGLILVHLVEADRHAQPCAFGQQLWRGLAGGASDSWSTQHSSMRPTMAFKAGRASKKVEICSRSGHVSCMGGSEDKTRVTPA